MQSPLEERKSARGSRGARGDGRRKRIITLISGGKMEVGRVVQEIESEVRQVKEKVEVR